MSYLRALAHLEEQLGSERFQVLVHSCNTGKVKKFCDRIIKNFDPTDVMIGGRTFDMADIINKMLVQTEPSKLTIWLGTSDGQHIVEYQGEIPVMFREKIVFVFAGEHQGGNSTMDITEVRWNSERWAEDHNWVYRDMIRNRYPHLLHIESSR